MRLRAREEEIQGYIAYEKPLLNEDKAGKSFDFTKKMKQILDKDPQFLENIIFIDETMLRLFNTAVGENVHVRCR
jgi:hypothetical protein